jgi:hypothetical protein
MYKNVQSAGFTPLTQWQKTRLTILRSRVHILPLTPGERKWRVKAHPSEPNFRVGF